MINLGSGSGLAAPPKAVCNGDNDTSPIANRVVPNSSANSGGRHVLCGSLAADTYKEILSVSGSGVLEYASVGTISVSSMTVTIKVVIDNVTIFEATSATFTAVNRGVIAVGHYVSGAAPAYEALPFLKSLSISIKRSASAQDNIEAVYRYYTT